MFAFAKTFRTFVQPILGADLAFVVRKFTVSTHFSWTSARQLDPSAARSTETRCALANPATPGIPLAPFVCTLMVSGSIRFA